MTDSLFKYSPAVCAAGDNYQIFIYTGNERCMMEVTVGGRSFTDDAVGVMRTECVAHNVTVPMELLNEVGAYTVHLTPITMTYTYEHTVGKTQSKTYVFRPLPLDKIKVLWLSDAHGLREEPLSAAKAAGDIDLLVMGGDVGGELKDNMTRDNYFSVISEITAGSVPVVSIKGNHEGRGEWAEKLGDFMPTPKGVPYYTFRLGSLWGVVLDCFEPRQCLYYGEGGNSLTRIIKEKETDFIRLVSDGGEASAEGIKYRMVFSHIPFGREYHDENPEEHDIHAQWVRYLGGISPNVLVCGHEHKIRVYKPEDDGNVRGMNFPMAVSSGYEDINGKETPYCTTLFTLEEGRVSLTFCGSNGAVTEYTKNPL